MNSLNSSNTQSMSQCLCAVACQCLRKGSNKWQLPCSPSSGPNSVCQCSNTISNEHLDPLPPFLMSYCFITTALAPWCPCTISSISISSSSSKNEGKSKSKSMSYGNHNSHGNNNTYLSVLMFQCLSDPASQCASVLMPCCSIIPTIWLSLLL